MSLTCHEIRTMAVGESQSLDIDWGDSTAGSETGALKNGDTVASCTVSITTKPTDADDPTFGAVSVPLTTLYVNGRSCETGEYTTCLVTMAVDQTAGQYVFAWKVTTTNGFILPLRKTIVEVSG